MELSDYVRVLKRYAVLVVLAAVLGGAAGSAYVLQQPKRYQSDATLLVTLHSGSTIGDVTAGATYAQQVVATYADVAMKPIVLQPVITSLGLHTTALKLAKDVVVTAGTTTTLLDITVTDTSPTRAAAIANAITQQLSRTVASISPAISGKTAPVELTVVERALPVRTPIAPNVPLTIGVGVLGGAALVIALAILRTALDTRIRRPEDVAAVTERPVLGGIARSPRVKRHPLIVRVDPLGRIAEEFRSIRTNLQFLDVDRVSRAIVVSSATESEGKTTTTTNLALTIADAGARVVIVDGDLRRPRVAHRFAVDGAVGLTDVLIGRATLDQALQEWGDGAVSLLPAGAIPPNPSELLQSSAMSELLAALEERFDTVIIDAPPLLPVSDAAILSHRAAGTILVAATGTATRRQLADSIAKVEQVGGWVLGVVMTKVPTKGADASETYAKYDYAPKPAPKRRRPQRLQPQDA